MNRILILAIAGILISSMLIIDGNSAREASSDNIFPDLSAYLYERAISSDISNLDKDTVIQKNGRDYPIGSVIWEYTITGGSDNSVKAISPIQDIDGDGIDDVIVCSEEYYIRCFSGYANGTGSIIWESYIYPHKLSYQNELVITDDVDGDGYEDIAIGTPWGGRSIIMLSGQNGNILWIHDTHEYGSGGWVYQVDCSYDYNGDGIRDVLASTGDDSTDTGPKRVYCLDALTGNSIWECYLGGPGFSVIGIEDFTGDGHPDVLAGASNEIETDGFVYGINGATGYIIWAFPVGGSSVWALAQIEDITGDGIKDVVVGDFYGNIYGLDATNGVQVYSNSLSGIITRFAKIDDVNGNGHPEIIPAHSTSHITMAMDSYTGNYIWTHSVADQPWNVAGIEDISGDGIDDVLVGTLYSNNYCYFLDGTDGSELAVVNYYEPVDAIYSIPDVAGDGSMEMVAGGRYGKLTCFSGGLNASANNPPGIPSINGSTTGIVGEEYEYTVVTTDPDGDNVYYYVDWGDGNATGWLGPFTSGTVCNATHSWNNEGIYNVRVKAKDTWNAQSEWSSPIIVEITSQITVSLMLYQGWNLITLPVENDYNASSLLNDIEGCSIILGWNASAGDFELYAPGVPNDFAIEDGHGYLVAVNNDTIFNITGVPIETVSVPLYIGWNMLGWFKSTPTNASSLLNSIQGCNIVLRWNASAGDFELYAPGVPNDFVVARGDGFLVAVTEQSIWHGEG
ncbi:MAG TPA: PKD domain-containing protein [Thermoplasmatales archaeon]|nr:PKD domain-containing protein [Thermoplasmatales archaeon]